MLVSVRARYPEYKKDFKIERPHSNESLLMFRYKRKNALETIIIFNNISQVTQIALHEVN